ncbi:cadherin-like beta sandwich domain-containing protein [Lacrimispora sp.]|uniref:cadherin-like beta sandwich domain-containing protein n=1 Tax=Lacrimispora sp. TaxID=2719234 RepID=UPI0039940710
MNKKLKKLIVSVMAVCMIAVVVPFGQMVSWASNTKIAFSDPSVMVGNEVTVTMKVTSDTPLGTAEIMLAYDPGILEFVSGSNANGGAGAIKVLGTMESADQKSFNFTLKFKTLQAGNAQINVTSQEIYDVNSQLLPVSRQGSSTVKVTSPATYSKDATLKSLKISPGTLTPAFSASVDQYTAEVDANTTDLVVNAVAANAGAHVTLQGEKGLKAGENQVVVKVTAEDGQTVKNYTIKVTKPEGGDTVAPTNENGETKEAEFGSTKVTVNGTEYSIATSFDESTLPEGFESSTYSYKGTEVMAGKGLEKDLLLLYLKDAGGNGGFFIYNEGADSWSQFVQVETSSKAIVVIPIDSDAQIPQGFKERQVDIDGVRVTGWVAETEAEPEYCVFYAMNWDGEKGFYRYDLKEKTIQRYFATGVSGDEYTKLTQTYNSLTKDYRIQFYLLIAVSVVALLLLVVVILLLRKGKGSGRNGLQAEDTGGEGTPASEDLKYYSEPEEELPSSRIKRYSREEFDKVSPEIMPEYKESERTMDRPEPLSAEEPEDDDFIVESSLEDIERNLASHVAERPAEPSGEEDDFEFMDLDD